MEMPTGYFAYVLGSAAAVCLLWWPICFLAARSSLGIVYTWYIFILGYVAAVLVTAPLIFIAGIFFAEQHQSIVTAFGAPIVASLLVLFSFAFVVKLRRRQEHKLEPNEVQKSLVKRRFFEKVFKCKPILVLVSAGLGVFLIADSFQSAGSSAGSGRRAGASWGPSFEPGEFAVGVVLVIAGWLIYRIWSIEISQKTNNDKDKDKD